MGVWDRHVHTAIFKKDNQQGPTVQHREPCSVLCGSLDGREVWGRMDTCIYVAESLCCAPETTQHCYSAILPYKIFKKNFFKSCFLDKETKAP